jgi:hypothetical protein
MTGASFEDVDGRSWACRDIPPEGACLQIDDNKCSKLQLVEERLNRFVAPFAAS